MEWFDNRKWIVATQLTETGEEEVREFDDPIEAVKWANEFLGVEAPPDDTSDPEEEEFSLPPAWTPTGEDVYWTVSDACQLLGQTLKDQMVNGEDFDGRYIWFKKMFGNYFDTQNKEMTIWWRMEGLIEESNYLSAAVIASAVLNEYDRLGITDQLMSATRQQLDRMVQLYQPEPYERIQEIVDSEGLKNVTTTDLDILYHYGIEGGNIQSDKNREMRATLDRYLEGAPENLAIRSGIIAAIKRSWATGFDDNDNQIWGMSGIKLANDQDSALSEGYTSTNNPIHPDSLNIVADHFLEIASNPESTEARLLWELAGDPGETRNFEGKVKWAAANIADQIRPYQWIPLHDRNEGAEDINASWAQSTQTLDSILLTEVVAEEFGGQAIPRENNHDIATSSEDAVIIKHDPETNMWFPVDKEMHDGYGDFYGEAGKNDLVMMLEYNGHNVDIEYGSDEAIEEKRISDQAEAHLDDPILRDQYSEWARDTYEETQTMLSDWGYQPGDTVRLFRGLRSDPHAPAAATWNPKQTVGDTKVKMWSLSSWSFDLDEAKNFGNNGSVVSADIPIERLFASWRTGPPCKGEGEWMVLGMDGIDGFVHDEDETNFPEIVNRAKQTIHVDELASNWIAALLFEKGEDRDTRDGLKPKKKSKVVEKSYPAPHCGRKGEQGGSAPRDECAAENEIIDQIMGLFEQLLT